MENIKFKNSDGIEYELVWKRPHYKYNADGLCYSPELDNPKILVDPKLKKRRKLRGNGKWSIMKEIKKYFVKKQKRDIIKRKKRS